MELLDGAYIQYDQGRAMDCRAVTNLADALPFNFLDYYDEHRARELAIGCSRFVTETVLNWRRENIEHRLPFPETGPVYDFVTSLGIEPYGKLSLVETAEGPDGHNSGLTTYRNLRSIVMKDMVFTHFDPDELAQSGLTDANIHDLNMMRAANVAAHELTHLAGVEDKVYFTINPEKPTKIIDIHVAGTSLENHPHRTRGGYFEEGLSALVGSLYTVHDTIR